MAQLVSTPVSKDVLLETLGDGRPQSQHATQDVGRDVSEHYDAADALSVQTMRHVPAPSPCLPLGDQKKLKEYERLQHEFAANVAASDDARSALQIEEERLHALRRQRGSSDEAKLHYLEREVETAWARLTEAEHARDASELALYRLQDQATLAQRVVANENLHAEQTSKEGQENEMRRARSKIRKENAARVARAEREAACSVEDARRASEAKKHQAKSVQRLKVTSCLRRTGDDGTSQLCNH